MKMTRNISYGRTVVPDNCRMIIRIMNSNRSELNGCKRPAYTHDLIPVCEACSHQNPCERCPMRQSISKKKKSHKRGKKHGKQSNE